MEEKGAGKEGKAGAIGMVGRILKPSPKAALGALRNMAIPPETAAGRRFIEGMIADLSPRRYALSRRDEWMNPPKTEESFRAAMRRAGVAEAEVARRHRTLAYSVYAMVGAASISVTSGVLKMIGGGVYYGAVMALAGLLLPGAMIFKFSLAAMQIRDRNLNTGWREWLARKWEWMPPPDSPHVPERKKKRRPPAPEPGAEPGAEA